MAKSFLSDVCMAGVFNSAKVTCCPMVMENFALIFAFGLTVVVVTAATGGVVVVSAVRLPVVVCSGSMKVPLAFISISKISKHPGSFDSVLRGCEQYVAMTVSQLYETSSGLDWLAIIHAAWLHGDPLAVESNGQNSSVVVF